MSDRNGKKPVQVEPQRKPKGDSTIAEVVRVYDPQIERVLTSIVETRNLGAIKEHLKDYEVAFCSIEGFNFQAFIENLKGTGGLSVGERKFNLLGSTRSAWILSKENCANIYEDGMMNVDFKKMVILRHKEKPNSMLYLYHMMPSDIGNLQMASGFGKMKAGSLKPALSEDGPNVETGEIKAKLAKAEFLKGTLEGFDLQAFVEGINMVIILFDSNRNPYYNIWTEGGDVIYRMYVDCGTHDMNYFDSMYILAYGKEHLRLYRED